MKMDTGEREVTMGAQVTMRGPLDMQVCVPESWTDGQVVEFANMMRLCGTAGGWVIRRAGNPALAGDPERVRCEDQPRFVHIMLDA